MTELKKAFPGPEYLSDKIADGGGYFADMAHGYGADYVTVLGCVEDATIISALKAAEKTGIKVVADMLGVRNFYERNQKNWMQWECIISVFTHRRICRH